MNNPLVSICIGTFNRSKYIRECLDSVYAQTYPNLEVIVADNASTDDTLDIVRTYRNVKIVPRDSNSGMCSTTRNLAVRAATGDLVAFLDSDDAWYPDKLEKQVAFMERHPRFPLSHTYCHLMDDQSVVYGVRHEKRLPPSGNYFEALLNHCWITISSTVIRRELYTECGPFTETLPYGQSGEDYEFFLKAAHRHDFGLVPDVLVKYRKSQDAITYGNWKGKPRPVPFLRELLRRRDIWGDRVTPARMNQLFAEACCENSSYWRDQQFPTRALWATGQAMAVTPLNPNIWNEGMRSVWRWACPRR